ncbi:MAG: hypothetical protein EBS10_04295 [Acidimicrobiia bacterium]|nr:hypothetical protein [Acidimicrobiia bacterium]
MVQRHHEVRAPSEEHDITTGSHRAELIEGFWQDHGHAREPRWGTCVHTERRFQASEGVV